MGVNEIVGGHLIYAKGPLCASRNDVTHVCVRGWQFKMRGGQRTAEGGERARGWCECVSAHTPSDQYLGAAAAGRRTRASLLYIFPVARHRPPRRLSTSPSRRASFFFFILSHCLPNAHCHTHAVVIVVVTK